MDLEAIGRMAIDEHGDWNPGIDRGQDPIGFVKGHITRLELAGICKVTTTDGFDDDELEDIDSADVWHGYIRKVPDSTGEFSSKWIPASGPSPGAFAVTLWCRSGGGRWHNHWKPAPKVEVSP